MIDLDGIAGGTKIATGIPGAVSNVVMSARTIKAQYVVSEHAKWRDKIRCAVTLAALQPTIQNRRSLWLTLKLNTNPCDQEDRAIVKLSFYSIEKSLCAKEQEELLDRVALLLKHDWERAKYEVGSDTLPRRILYAEYRGAVERDNFESLTKYWSGQTPVR